MAFRSFMNLNFIFIFDDSCFSHAAKQCGSNSSALGVDRMLSAMNSVREQGGVNF